jgi:hypothetical protein
VKSSALPYSIEPVTLKPGRELIRGETSSSSAYGILDRRKGRILRVALSQEIAELLAADYQHRKVVEMFLVTATVA